MQDILADFIYRNWIQQGLFERSQENPEIAHQEVVRWLERLQKHPSLCHFLGWMNRVQTQHTSTNAFGLRFPNPVGLAAGFDKYATIPLALEALGFGFIELGGFTPLAQDGNPEPRIMRFETQKHLWNSMGLNNPGADKAGETLANQVPGLIPRGVNVAKGKDTPRDDAHEDYVRVITVLYKLFDYFMLNVSSPNTLGLRDLQFGRHFRSIVSEAVLCSRMLARECGLLHPKPVGVKIAHHDMADKDVCQIADDCIECEALMLCIGNTKQEQRADGRTGGLSGPSLYDRTHEACGIVHEHTNGRLPIIACGGIDCVERAWELLEIPSVQLLQIYTALIFEGPGFPRRLARQLAPLMKQAL